MLYFTGRVEPGLPTLSMPPFSVSVDNSTVTFVDMVHQLGAGVLMMPVVMVLANIAIAKAFCEYHSCILQLISSANMSVELNATPQNL